MGIVTKFDIAEEHCMGTTICTIGGDGTAYGGLGKTNIYSYGDNFEETTRLSFVATDGAFLREIFATDVPGEVFYIYRETNANGGCNNLYRSVDYGMTSEKVLELGDNAGTQISNVWALQCGFVVTTIGGVRTYLIAEYNVNSSRTAGGTNDKVRLFKSTTGTLGSWTPIMTWNTAGSRIIIHVHAVKVDPYSGLIYILVGDTNPESAIIQWDPEVGTWVDNISHAALASRAGFKVIHGSQSCRAVDILFTEKYNHWAADTNSPGVDSGIWRSNKDLSGKTQRVIGAVAFPTWHEGWSGVVTDSGKILLTTEPAAGATDRQLRVFESADDGDSYSLIGLFGTVAATTGYLRVNKKGNDIILGGINTVQDYSMTMIIRDTGVVYKDEFPPIFFPVYHVSVDGVDGNASGTFGRKLSQAWRTVAYALTSSRMTNGGRLIVHPGVHDLDNCYVNTADFGTGLISIEGKGKEQTTVRGTTAAASYVLYLGGANDKKFLIKDVDIHSLQPVSGAKNIIYAGGGSVTNVQVYLRDAKVGNKDYATGGVAVLLYNTLDSKNSEVEGAPGQYGINISKNGAALTIDNNIITGGTVAIAFSAFTDVAVFVTGTDFYEQTAAGVSISGNQIPTVKNCIFKSSSPTCKPISDNTGLTQTDAHIDGNCYDTPVACTGLENAGGSHSITADPLFVDAANGNFHLKSNSPCIEAGVFIASIHEQATPATDFDGTIVCFTPNIGPYGQGNTKTITSDYSPTGYGIRAGATVVLGAHGLSVDFTGLTLSENNIRVKEAGIYRVHSFTRKPGTTQYVYGEEGGGGSGGSGGGIFGSNFS
jgi:hypothetical protein